MLRLNYNRIESLGPDKPPRAGALEAAVCGLQVFSSKASKVRPDKRRRTQSRSLRAPGASVLVQQVALVKQVQ